MEPPAPLLKEAHELEILKGATNRQAIRLKWDRQNRQGNIMTNYDNCRERIKFDFRLNIGFLVLTIYLTNLVDWVEFVTGTTFRTHL